MSEEKLQAKLRALVAEKRELARELELPAEGIPEYIRLREGGRVSQFCDAIEALLAERQEPPATPMGAAISLEERLTESIWAISDGEHPAKDTLRELIRNILASTAAAPSSRTGEE